MPEKSAVHRFLQDILGAKAAEIKKLSARAAALREVEPKSGANAFAGRIGKPGGLNCIAEIKKKSPSKGLLRDAFHVEEIAGNYRNLDVSAISVLTERDYFGGEPEFIGRVKQVTSQPVLRKDFILDELQVYESCALGADALLLIVRILSPRQLKDYIDLARTLNLEALVEIHEESELDIALKAGAKIIGVNNRDLVSFHTDLAVSLNCAGQIPENVLSVCESGLHSPSDLSRVQAAGFNAVLMGEYFMRAANIEDAFNLLFNNDQN